MEQIALSVKESNEFNITKVATKVEEEHNVTIPTEVENFTQNYIQDIQTKVDNAKNDTEKAYYKRMLSLLKEPNLTKVEPHPVKDIVDKIVNSPYYKDFEIVESPEVVNEYATFDLFFFPKDHVARRPSDSFFIEKNEDTKKSILLRPHTTVVWYYYLIEQ
jgi:phenylalanyl-tRNA synthetase alpha subunit